MAITISGDSPNFTSVAATTITNVTNISSNAADTPVILGDSGTNYNTCRAWVNFNGTGTVAIRADFNVSSITDNGTGNYTVNFTNALADANYSAVTQTGSVGATNVSLAQTGTYATGSIQVFTVYVSSGSDRTLVDMGEISVAIFR